ncbi:tetratricopeptide repeat protein 23 [Aplochiton taeniatus]
MSDYSMTKARSISTESTGSSASPLSERDAVSQFSMEGNSMMTPEDKLIHCESRAQVLEENQQFDACIQDLVRCVALTRLVYGDGHLKLAQAHTRLAKAYLQLKGWGVQAQEHASRARELLPLYSPMTTSREDRVLAVSCLLSIHLTQGGAALLTGKAESSHVKAEKVVEELYWLENISQEDKINIELEILTNLSRVFQRQGRWEKALAPCQRSLDLLGGRDRTGTTLCSVYKDMAAIEQAQGRLDQAIEHLSKAHARAVSQSPGGLEGAHIAHSLALALSTATEQPHHKDSAAHYFEESLSAYQNSAGPRDAVTLTVQDDYCRFLLLTGQQDRCVELQRVTLPLKTATFGDLSAEVEETLQLIGGVELSQGRLKQAYRTLRKCLEIQNLMYGPQLKKTRSTQKTVDMLALAPEVARRQKKEGSMNSRPPFCAVVPTNSKGGGPPNMCDS